MAQTDGKGAQSVTLVRPLIHLYCRAHQCVHNLNRPHDLPWCQLAQVEIASDGRCEQYQETPGPAPVTYATVKYPKRSE